jgi:hypothetical protein
MTRSRTATRLAAAAFAGWSALSAAAPGVAGRQEFDAGLSRRAPAEGERALEAGLRSEAFRLWKAGGFGGDRSERAAWVVQAPSGVAWRDWPWDRRYLESRWLGPTPGEAVAIVHTHPAVVDPRPSVTDRATATRLGIAVYTVSRSGIWKVEPGGAVTRVGDETWWAGCETGRSCREGAPARAARVSSELPAALETAALPLRITE